MKKELRETFLAEAIRIGNEIIEKAESDKNGKFIRTITMDHEMAVTWQLSGCIYDGTGGVALFLMELYRVSGERSYLLNAVEFCKWTISYYKQVKDAHPSFLTGLAGAAFVSYKIYELTGNKYFLNECLKILKSLTTNTKINSLMSEYISGLSGTLFVLLYVYSGTGRKDLLIQIKEYTNRLISRAHLYSQGVYWDRLHSYVKSLCGFSHGGSGIGMVFLELGKIFKNDVFNLVAEQAFLYEKKHYNKKNNNWLDFRKGAYREKELLQHKAAYLNNDFDFFTDNIQDDTNAWCHGAAGIGLSRVKAYDYLGKYGKELNMTIKKTISSDIKNLREYVSPTLCHGYGGNAELFIFASSFANKHGLKKNAEHIAEWIINRKKTGNSYLSGYLNAGQTEDYSLFVGNAGIGYFLLRLLEPDKVPSILAPSITLTDKTNNENIRQTFTKETVVNQLLLKYFEKTIKLIKFYKKNWIHDFVTEYIRNNNDNIAKLFNQYIYDLKKRLNSDKAVILQEVYRFEKAVYYLNISIYAYSLLYVKSIIQAEQYETIKTLSFKQITGFSFQESFNFKIIKSRWDWSEEFDIHEYVKQVPLLQKNKDFFIFLLIQSIDKVNIYRIEKLAFIILKLFEKEKTFEAAAEQFLECYSCNESDFSNIRLIFAEQVKQLVKLGVLKIIYPKIK
jgi:hypothetical protein